MVSGCDVFKGSKVFLQGQNGVTTQKSNSTLPQHYLSLTVFNKKNPDLRSRVVRSVGQHCWEDPAICDHVIPIRQGLICSSKFHEIPTFPKVTKKCNLLLIGLGLGPSKANYLNWFPHPPPNTHPPGTLVTVNWQLNWASTRKRYVLISHSLLREAYFFRLGVEWHSIPAGMECSFHSCRNGVLIPFLQEWNDCILFLQEWN